MARSALTRRRGTLRSSRRGSRKSSNYRLGLNLLIGFALIVGVTGGVIFYILFSLTLDNSPSKTEVSLRKKHKHAVSSQHESMSDGSDHNKINEEEYYEVENDDSENYDTGGGKVAKEHFVNHVVKIGTTGAFPHYPDKPLVEKRHDFKDFEANGGNRFKEYKHGDSPYTFVQGESDELARSRRYHVKKAMQHAWAGYEKYAFGMDELCPVSMTGNSRWGGMATTLVDSLDTLWLMDMKDEFFRARDWVKTKMNNHIDKKVSVFETTIRSLGGLLSAYDWSQDKAFLDQAEDLGHRLFKSFDTKSGIPYAQTNLETGESSNLSWSRGSTNIAEAGSLQLEFRALGRLTGVKDFKTKSEKIFRILDGLKPPNGLYPAAVRNRKAQSSFSRQRQITFGARADSFYEYMLKIWLQGGKTEARYREMYDESIQGMHDHLLTVSTPSELVFIADQVNGEMNYKMDHLVCFMGGLLALGAYTDPQGLHSERAQRDLKTAKALTYTCYQMYARMPTGISPEYVQFHSGEDFSPGRDGRHYLLRPETVESFFVLYHLTGDPIYREWGWEVFQAIERYCKTDAGYGQLKNVRNPHRPPEDSMESFFLAETLKYLYLLFDPDTPIDLLNKHVFNTEAHPMRIFPVMDEDGVMDLLK